MTNSQALLLIICCLSAQSADLAEFQPIGPVSGISSSASSVVISCQDQSQVRIDLLAPDLVRVRAAYGTTIPEANPSWAIAKTSWDVPRWKLAETKEALEISTDELVVVVHRNPLLIDFVDAKTGHVINADHKPMMHDAGSQAIAATKKLGFDEHFYGLGEKAARLDKRRGQFTMWNTDAFGYKEGTDPLYQSIPFYIGWEHGDAYGIFYDNSYRTHFDMGANSQEFVSFQAEGGAMDYYFFRGPSIKKILGRYAELTGHMPLPPMWSLGHQQSRYSYYPDRLVEQVVERYRKDDLPLDAIHLDIHYMNGYRVFTWDPERFPNPKAMTDRLRRQGVKVVTIVDPGIKIDPGYSAYDQGKAADYFLKRKDGKMWVGKVWPGEAAFVDYTIDAAARWWGDLFRAYTDQGVAGIWLDMNEPSDFIDQTGTSQMDVVMHDGGARSTLAKGRNQFALHMARATYQGLERLRPDERPFLLTRAGYAGIQRWAALWTGDNTASWEHFGVSIPMFQSVGLSGEPFVGADVGGFIGRTDGELLTRWYQVGFLTPFFRNHAELSGYDHEPWRFGKYYEDIIRKYLKLRYRLLPFLYARMEEAHRTGVPVFRPLLLNFQNDAETLNIDDEFMIGDDLLVAPILKPGATARRLYLPQGQWFDYWTGTEYRGEQMIRVEAPLEIVPMFVRGGAILPLGPEMNWVGEKSSNPITFHVYPDRNGRALASLYEDDGISMGYQRGVFRRTEFSALNLPDRVEIAMGAPQGTYRSGSRDFEFVWKRRSSITTATIDGTPLPATAWSKTADGVTLRIPDDGRAHRIVVR
jgi:alpha-glucosidase